MSEQPDAPKQLGRYELIYMLGQGGMGEVHLAKITGAAGFEKLCIVKTILPQMKADEQFVNRFQHEAKVLVQLAHSNIAQVYDMGEADGTLFMAIEYIAGVDLSRVVGRAGELGTVMPVPVSLFIGQKMAEALGYAHRKVGSDGAPLGIVHRDISPHNVMVSYEGEIKVIDFGLAKSKARSKHTLPATVLGKLGYMSPEQARAEKVDHRSDIYSCGVVVWEMLAGRPLFHGETVGEMVAMMANPQVPALHELRQDITPELDRVVQRALVRSTQDRYARCDDFARALNEQLIKEGNIGAEEVGNYVKSLCPEEFAEQRKLLSRFISKPQNKSVTTLPKGAGLSGTAIRAPASAASHPVQPMEPVAPQAPRRGSGPVSNVIVNPASYTQPAEEIPTQRPISQPQVVARPPSLTDVALQKSKLPVVLLIAVLLIGLGVGGALLVPRLLATPPPPQEKITRIEVPAKVEPPAVAVKEPVKEEPVKEEPEPAKEEPAQEAPAAVQFAEPIDFVVREKAFPIFEDRERYVKAGKKDGLLAGSEIDVVGPPDKKNKKRPLYGTATVMEVIGDHLSRLDGAFAKPKSGAIFGAFDRKKLVIAKAAPPKADPVKDPAKADPAKDPAKADPAKDPAKADPAKDPAKTVAKAEPAKTEPAKVETPPPPPAKTEPPPVATTPTPPAAPAYAVLPVAIEVSGSRVTVHNKGQTDWRSCLLELPDRRRYRVIAINAGDRAEVSVGDFFWSGPKVEQPITWVIIRCLEGSAKVNIR